MEKPIVLALTQYYLPGYKSGGPIRTLANMVAQLGERFQFKIVTTDRDFEDKRPYNGIEVDAWNQVGAAEVYYCSPQNRSIFSLRRIIQSTPRDVLYLNSFFQPTFTIQPLVLRRLRAIPETPIILAPRGEFSEGALSLKRGKKHLYLRLAKMIGLYEDITWQASSEQEARDIRDRFEAARVMVAPNLPSPATAEKERERERASSERPRILFLSRITPMKNLKYALRVIGSLKEDIQFNIYGPIDDKGYWKECESMVEAMPQNVEVTYMGSVPHREVKDIMARHDLFFLPTRGENFGHVIIEALSAGCPVLISDQTPWQGLREKGVGWDVPLDRPEEFRRIFQCFVQMGESTYMEWRRRAQEFGRTHQKDRETVQKNITLFQQALH